MKKYVATVCLFFLIFFAWIVESKLEHRVKNFDAQRLNSDRTINTKEGEFSGRDGENDDDEEWSGGDRENDDNDDDNEWSGGDRENDDNDDDDNEEWSGGDRENNDDDDDDDDDEDNNNETGEQVGLQNSLINTVNTEISQIIARTHKKSPKASLSNTFVISSSVTISKSKSNVLINAPSISSSTLPSRSKSNMVSNTPISSTSPQFCGDGHVQPWEECDPTANAPIPGLTLIFCTPNCTWNKDPQNCDSVSSDYEIRRIARAMDLYIFRANNDLQGGVVNHAIAERVIRDSNLIKNGYMAPPLDSDNSSYWTMNLGDCVFDNETGETPTVYFDASRVATPESLPLFECCDSMYCNALSLRYSEEYCALPNGICNQTEMFNIANEIAYEGHTLCMTRVNQEDTPSCFNLNESQVQTHKLTGRQKLCCAANIFRTINAGCNAGFDWGLDITDPNAFTVLTDSRPDGGFIESDFGYETLAYEDHAPDHDNNDVVLRHREVCAYIYVNSTFSPAISCYSYLNNVARGGGYDNQFYLSIEGNVLPPAWPYPPQTPCVFFDYLSPVPPNRILPQYDLYEHYTPSNQTPETGWSNVDGLLSTRYLLKPGKYPNNVNLTASFACSYVVSDPFYNRARTTSYCDFVTGDTDLIVYPSFKSNLPSNLPLGEESYPNTMNSTSESFTENAYNVFLSWNYLHPYESTRFIDVSRALNRRSPVQNSGEVGTGVPRLRYYVNNLSCNKQIDLIDIDARFSDNSRIPWAFTVPKSLWCWALEGIPLYMPDKITGQCVFGQKNGKSCDVVSNQCPFSFCVVGSNTCYGTSDPCNVTSQCPYGRDCYTRNNYCNSKAPFPCDHPAGSYPNVYNYQVCFANSCYNDYFSLPPPLICASMNCFDESVMRWYFYPNPNIETHLYVLNP